MSKWSNKDPQSPGQVAEKSHPNVGFPVFRTGMRTEMTSAYAVRGTKVDMATTKPFEQTVLFVDASPDRVREGVSFLQTAGYRAIGATSFDAARNLLANPPDVLISSLRLRSFNGLHLVLHGRFLRPDLVAAVVDDHLDAFLSAEAARRGVAYLVRPLRAGALLAWISAGLEQRSPHGAPDDIGGLYRDRRVHDRRHDDVALVDRDRRVGDRRHATIDGLLRLP